MANIATVACSNAGTLTPEVATAPAGDIITGANPGKALTLAFRNGHASSITVNIAPTVATMKVGGVGKVSVPTRSIAIAAAASGTFVFQPDEIGAYIDANGGVPLTYTAGNALLTVRAIQ